MSSSTAEFINRLVSLKEGDLGILRKLRGCNLDEALSGFDLFSGIWWPLRQKNQFSPRREIAWLVSKLYAEFRFQQEDGMTLPHIMGKIYARLEEKKRKMYIPRFDSLLSLEVVQLEQPLSVALGLIRDHNFNALDWVRLTDDLSKWENMEKRAQWTLAFRSSAYKINKEDKNVD